MLFDDLSIERQRFIESFKYLDKGLCIELSDALVEADAWQQFRERMFNILDNEHKKLNVLRDQVVRI